ncbi:hypothetical protein [Leptobacterium sp. I13]|uniref:hypothetical protein n=1 Tax=Leptobacterium meishanense TaxID=3128904 RepID=UPI0030EF5B91
MKLINQTQNTLHHLAQFLAAFSNSYLQKEDDDSQSNIGWSVVKKAMVSRSVDGVHLELSYPNVTLKIIKEETTVAQTTLSGMSRAAIDSWIRKNLEILSLDSNKFNYELGFSLDTSFSNFSIMDDETMASIQQLIQHRTIAQKALEKLAKAYAYPTEIRVWPHHFDTGMLIDLSDDQTLSKGLGLGYAIADSVSNVPYFYTYAWGNDTIDYKQLPPLANGKWATGDWKGALLRADELFDLKAVESFYQGASYLLSELL